MTQQMLCENNWHLHRTTYDNSEKAKKIIFKLKKIRANKSFPAIDNKAICSWNCMMVNGLLDASITYSEKEYLDIAEMLLKLIFKKFTNKKHQCNKNKYTHAHIYQESNTRQIQISKSQACVHSQIHQLWFSKACIYTYIGHCSVHMYA